MLGKLESSKWEILERCEGLKPVGDYDPYAGCSSFWEGVKLDRERLKRVWSINRIEDHPWLERSFSLWNTAAGLEPMIKTERISAYFTRAILLSLPVLLIALCVAKTIPA